MIKPGSDQIRRGKTNSCTRWADGGRLWDGFSGWNSSGAEIFSVLAGLHDEMCVTECELINISNTRTHTLSHSPRCCSRHFLMCRSLPFNRISHHGEKTHLANGTAARTPTPLLGVCVHVFVCARAVSHYTHLIPKNNFWKLESIDDERQWSRNPASA